MTSRAIATLSPPASASSDLTGGLRCPPTLAVIALRTATSWAFLLLALSFFVLPTVFSIFSFAFSALGSSQPANERPSSTTKDTCRART